MSGNNLNREYSDLRDSFLSSDGEKSYLDTLLSKSTGKQALQTAKKLDSKTLFDLASQRVEAIETGKVKPEDLERYEGEIALLLSAIEDCVRDTIRERTSSEKGDR